ncbi:helix-turn-helix domain-containing protein [Parahaliea maris]|uniref:Helix-turn-helix domain-containing protein n=1 Tax=Parahaliea maris TaxID=2716870 RepID=A0A5C8ZTN8_9GAMM|nr:helix-turn-helix domain-containing protein [Parahaliea maris]TXS91863.1 helix-turn-helix domain-containing protein [Parahaliea maris]
MGRTYSTEDVRSQDGFDHWEDWVSTTYSAPTTNINLADGQFRGSLAVKSLGKSALITRIQSSPVAYNEVTTSEYSDNYFICLSLCPISQLTQNGQTSEQESGDIVICDGGQPYSFHFPKGDDQVVISLPHTIFDTHINDAQSVTNKTLKHGSPLGQFIASMISQAWESEEQEELYGDKVLESILSMLDTAYRAASDGDKRQVTEYKKDNLQRAKEYIVTHLSDPALSLERISHDIHLSSRTLSRLFAKEGTTAIRWLWQQRLDACRRAILSEPNAQLGDIAHRYGFSNTAHFSKMFKETYGLRPSAFRDQY